MFEAAYLEFIALHAKQRKGESLRRLMEGHGHAEKMFLQNVWWPAFGHFEHLHPEHEIRDFRDGYRFLDFAFTPPRSPRLAIEVDGFGPHSRAISRSQFSDNLMRQNHLILDGWKVLRFSYDDLTERSRMCQQLVHQFMGKYIAGVRSQAEQSVSSEEKDIVRLALRLRKQIYPKDVCELLQIEQQKARRLLHLLVQKGFLQPAGTGLQRIYCFRLKDGLNVDFVDGW